MANTLYLVEVQNSIGQFFIEVDRDSNSREFILGLIRMGEVDPVKVLEVCEDEGWVRDVTADILEAAGTRRSDYRTTLTGEDKAAWEHDRRRALEMAS